MWDKLTGWSTGSHTIVLGRILTFLGIVATIGLTVDWTPAVPKAAVPFIALGLGVVIELVRRYKADDV